MATFRHSSQSFREELGGEAGLLGSEQDDADEEGAGGGDQDGWRQGEALAAAKVLGETIVQLG
jgi:hypothetical protein